MKTALSCRPARIGHVFLALLVCGLLTSRAAVDGTITTKEGRTLSGQIEWKPASRSYVVQQGNTVLNIAPDKVARVQVRPPSELEGAIAQVRAGKAAAAIPVLKQIVERYRMLEHDVTAGRWLAEAYLKTADAKNAVAVCEELIRVNPQVTQREDFAQVYADALLADEQYGKLKEILTRQIQTGSRAAAAVAQLKRGDLEMKRGNYKEALLDGFLRIVVLFEDIKSVQPEALYKAAICFDHLGQGPYAEKMRKKLLEEFPQDPYAQQVRAGK